MLLISAPAGNLLAEEVLYARFPALSPDGRTVAFSYHGDIWTVASSGGVASRLTAHEADDMIPHFSPDGRQILFSSRRNNNYDIFIMPVEGGKPKQLTFNSAFDVGTGWFPAGDSVLFTSKREGWRDIFKVSTNGGMPIKLTGYPKEQEYNGHLSPDGRYLLYNTGSGASRWWRRDLRSSRNAEIFLQDRSEEEFTSTRLTDYANHDVWPVLNSEKSEVYFVSCRGDWAQIFKVPVTGGDPIQLTEFTDDGVQWLNSNPQGTILVFEQGFRIWLLDPSNGVPKEVPITIRADERANLIEKRTFDGNVEWYSLSPDEKKIAAVIHGEVFVLPAEDPEEGIRITHTSARERFVVWGSDSKTVYYSSDRTGNYDIFSADVMTGVETNLTNSDENEAKPVVSPDGKYLAYYRGLDKIIRYDLETESESVWIEGTFFDLGVEPTSEYGWSHDSKWLVFTMAGSTYETDIFVADLDGTTHNISKFAEWNFRPRFSSDGKQVYFTSTINDSYDTYKIDLVRKPVEFFESSFDSLFLEEEEERKDDDSEEEKSKEIEDVVIDFERIEIRRSKAYPLASWSSYPVLTPGGKKYIFVASLMGKPELWSVNAEGDADLKQLTHSGKNKSYVTVTSDSKSVFFLEGGKVKKCGIDGSDAETLSFKARMEIDHLSNNRQKFNESWAMLNEYFYDPKFHGADWEATRRKYEPAVDHVRTDRDFRDLLLELMGELRASHLNAYSNEPGPSKNIETGRTGIVIDYHTLDLDGMFRISHVVPESPAATAGIKPGEYIRSIAGVPLSRETNINRLLAGTEGLRLVMTTSYRPDGKGEDIKLKPVSNSEIRNLEYKDWVKGRRHVVDSLSGGKLAYIHIPRMAGDRLDIFKHELVSIAETIVGLIIDVRDNGGGNIAVHLLGILVKTPYFLRNFRGFPTTSENKMRSNALEKPMALLINNYSASNSEIFAEGFRKLKLGKIIGEPTSGAVIGTSSYTLIDGSRIRRPSWGAFTAEMEDTDLKSRQPDILVENLPDDFMNGRDPQLVRAVEELMSELL
jgi:Tol biopolymer transport system component